MRSSAFRGPIPLLLFILIFANISLTAGTVRAASVSVSMHMAGEAPLWNGTTPVFVAGIWHQVTVNLAAFLNGGSLTLGLRLPGGSPPSPSNAYAWVRNEANNSWYDPLYGMFLRQDLSADHGTSITFGVGVDSLATPGAWTLEAVLGNVTVITEEVAVQAPRIEYGVSAPDFLFRINPFTPSIQTSQSSNEALKITNRGNVPLGTGASFDLLQSNLSLAGAGSVAHVGSVGSYYVRLSVGSLPPQVVEVNGTTEVYVAYAVPSAGSSVLVPSFQQTFHVSAVVGREGYDVQVVGNVAFQTLDTVHASYGSLVMWQVYLSGLQNVSLNVSVAGATLRNVFDGNQALAMPATIPLSGMQEHALTIQVEADQPGTATVTFSLHLLSTGDTRVFTTTIPVAGGPATAASSAGGNLLWLAGAFGTIIVFGFIGLAQLRRRPRGKRSTVSVPVTKHRRAGAKDLRNGPANGSGTVQRQRTSSPGQEDSARRS